MNDEHDELRWRGEALNNVLAALQRDARVDCDRDDAAVVDAAFNDKAPVIDWDIEDIVAEDDAANAESYAQPAWQRWFEDRGRSLAVTTLSAQMWCEQQVALEKELGRRRVATSAMKQGNIVHEKLEHNVHGEPVIVATQTLADYYAIRIVDTIHRLRQLQQTGVAREIWVLGSLDVFMDRSMSDQDAWCNGIIDEITIRPWPRCAMSRCLISDTKTRQRPFLPGIAQKRTSRIQLLLYKYCLDRLMTGQRPQSCPICAGSGVVGCRPSAENFVPVNVAADEHAATARSLAWIDAFLNAQRVDPGHVEFSQETHAFLVEQGLQRQSIQSLMMLLVSEFVALPRLSDELTVTYLTRSQEHVTGTNNDWGEKWRKLGSDTFVYSFHWLWMDLSHFLVLWQGRRRPEPVNYQDRWKCKSCDFYRNGCLESPLDQDDEYNDDDRRSKRPREPDSP